MCAVLKVVRHVNVELKVYVGGCVVATWGFEVQLGIEQRVAVFEVSTDGFS